MKNILVIGSGGYVSTHLTTQLVEKNYKETVFDLFIYGNFLTNHNNLKVIKGDVRDLNLLKKIIKNKLSFINYYNIKETIKELVSIFEKKLLVDSLNNEIYYNIKKMTSLNLK